VLFRSPLHLETGEETAVIFQVIDLLLLVASPEIGVHIDFVVEIIFHPFAYQKILPQMPRILAKMDAIEVSDHGISNTGVEKINFPCLPLVMMIVIVRRGKFPGFNER
jgi:hypothetical protein